MNNEQTDIKKMSVVKLESLAYRELVKAQTAQSNVQVINQELANRQEPVKEEKKDVGKDK